MLLLIGLLQALLQALYEEGTISYFMREGSGDWLIKFSNGTRYRLTLTEED